MLDYNNRHAVNYGNDSFDNRQGSAILSRLISRDLKMHSPYADKPVGPISTPSQLAQSIGAPIVLVTMVEANNLLTYHSFGLAPGRALGRLSKVSHDRCQDGAYLKADISRDEEFSEICQLADIGLHHFFVGVPVYNDDGELIGTVAVLDRSSNVMTRGYSIKKLREKAAEYITQRNLMESYQSGKLQEECIAA
ncbi:hypothetical protein ACR9YC_01690 [Parasphingorhabdus sp. DH2-15]|uniref:hypothetical protein n=1 Tax=Parasphingorhabdus sp. DH2-15 TaxID=3444112 RepID=UPI003F685A24